jgi:hypothetical protein
MRVNLIIKIILKIAAGSMLACCGVSQSSRYEAHLEALKVIVKPGDDIYSAKRKLKSKGLDVSAIHDPTGLGKNLSMHVHIGLSAGVIDGLKYAAGISDEGSVSALIEADGSGRIVSIK